MPDPTASPLVPLLLIAVVVLAVALARARRWAAVCQRCEWRARALTRAAADRAARYHGGHHGHDVQLYRRVDPTDPTTDRSKHETSDR